MKARIITIGDEILIGQIVDTNSAWLSAELNLVGIDVHSIWSISDTKEAIHQALDDTPAEVSLVIMTGGLGPTKDDVTKKALGEWFGSGWREDPAVLERVKALFARRGIEMPAVNAGQALVPDNCEVLFNGAGTAPGMWFERANRHYISLPGVPFEMKHLFTNKVQPKLSERFGLLPIQHRTVLTQGIGESSLMERIADWEDALGAKGIRLAYLPSPGSVRLRLSASDNATRETGRLLEQEVESLLPRISDFVFGLEKDTLEAVVGRLLKHYGLTVSLAESCTGGYVSHLLTSVPGSSAYFLGGAVTYANSAKSAVLQVREADIETHGAVSETVAIQMAVGARALYGSDFAVAITGIAGPDGGSIEKPVGTVWIAVATPEASIARRYQMGDNRERNIRTSALQALHLLRRTIIDHVKISTLEALQIKL